MNSPNIQMTDAAKLKLKQLLEEEEESGLMLRIFITGGGCSGFQYGFTFEEEKTTDDIVFEQDVGVALIVDPMSLQYLVGSTIDFVESVLSSQFTINNPNAETTCGCGSSFST
jgi:iron-sulfur cluster insertion protein